MVIELEPTVRIPDITALLDTAKSPPVMLTPDLAVTRPTASTLVTSS